MDTMQYPNIVEFEVTGDYALFSDPVMRIGGEKCSYQIPTYEALKGILHSIYWKPTITWVVDAVRIMNPIQMEVKGIRPIRYHGGNDLAYYTYLKNCRYQVRAHFEWNLNRPELAADRNENKHHQIALKMIRKGGRRDIFLGTRECQGYVEPCVFGESEGVYDAIPRMDFGLMYHGITYADEAYNEDTKGRMTARFWRPVMENGIIRLLRPEDCPHHKPLRDMEMKPLSLPSARPTPHGVGGLKYGAATGSPEAGCPTPHGVGGLKYRLDAPLQHAQKSHPARGGWIEISALVTAVLTPARPTPHGVGGLKC